MGEDNPSAAATETQPDAVPAAPTPQADAGVKDHVQPLKSEEQKEKCMN